MKLYYKEIGQGEPVLFLHGLFGMSDNWQTFAKRVADMGFRSILIDQRDHGRSPWTNEFNYGVLANDILELCDQSGLDKYSILGHSMGGKTAMSVAKHVESRIEKLIIVDVAPKRYLPGHEEIFAALHALPLTKAQNRNELYELLKIKLDDEMVVQFLMKNIQRDTDGQGFSLKFNVSLLEREYDNIIDDVYINEVITTKTLFCRGDRSPYILEKDYDKIHQIFQNAIIETIPEAGHWVQADQPDLLFNSVSEFLLS